jgi:hypothetical protein
VHTVDALPGPVARAAVERAIRAPSVHNTQPWRFAVGVDGIDVFADPSRRLAVMDPNGRQMWVSVGCAVLNLRVSLAAAGLPVRIEALPDPSEPDLACRVRVDPTVPVAGDLAALDPVVDARRSNRRAFSETPVPSGLVDTLEVAVRAEGARLHRVGGAPHLAALARLSQQADADHATDSAYRAELQSWVGSTSDDGIPAGVIPQRSSASGDEVPLRDFDLAGTGLLPAQTRSTTSQCLLILGTDTDERAAWLRAGAGLERALLEVTRAGFAASMFTQVVEMESLRARLREELGLAFQPQLVLRVGKAKSVPRTPRRAVADVLQP